MPYYGIPKAALCDLSKLRKPVQGHFGATDPMKGFSDAASARAMEATLKAAGSDTEARAPMHCMCPIAA